MRIIQLTLLALVSFNVLASDVVTGKEAAYFSKMTAYELNASPDKNPEHAGICQQRFGWILNDHVIDIDYSINTKTGIQFAKANLMNSEINLFPMGLESSYSFLSMRGIPEALKNYSIDRVYLKLDKDFSFRTIAISLIDKDMTFQCIASESK